MNNIQYAEECDLDAILALIKERILWMEERGMDQWNKGDYLSYYTPEYFLTHIRAKEFLVMKHEEKLVGAVGFFHDDERWDHDSRFVYLHHLAASPHHPGTGKALVLACEKEARDLGKIGVRLDCQKGNVKINDFYEALGYTIKGSMTSGEYHGIKREKLF